MRGLSLTAVGCDMVPAVLLKDSNKVGERKLGGQEPEAQEEGATRRLYVAHHNPGELVLQAEQHVAGSGLVLSADEISKPLRAVQQWGELEPGCGRPTQSKLANQGSRLQNGDHDRSG
mmetsp:Transcript_41908/g.132132  ORF Transcript_41908/g.132132 Transcript_41908/m.132132 type:complete len:118 (+) Transcript_41908:320-673(+)